MPVKGCFTSSPLASMPSPQILRSIVGRHFPEVARMHLVTLPLIVKLAGFLLAILPLLIGGLAMLVLDRAMGWSDQSLLASAGWIIAGMAILFVLHLRIIDFPGGVAKTLMALLPWFAIESYLTVVSAGLLLAGLVGYATRRDAQVVPPLVIAGIVVLAL